MASKFTEKQAKIAHYISSGPKTSEEISSKLSLPLNETSEELKGMMKLKLVRQDGYPLKYSLAPEIENKLKERKEIAMEDSYKLRLKIITDVQSIEENLAMKSLDEVEKALRQESDFTIYDIHKAKPVKEGEHYTSYLEAELSVKNFPALVRLVYFFGPTSIEILKPDKLEIPVEELQDGIMDMVEMVQSYNYHILKLMNKKELDEFQRKLLK